MRFFQRLLNVSIAALFVAGCTNMKSQQEADTTTPAGKWTDGKTTEEIVDKMSTNAENVDPETAGSDTLQGTNTDSSASVSGDRYRISWQVPAGVLQPSGWKISAIDPTDETDDTGTELDPTTIDVIKDTVTVDDVPYDVYSVIVPAIEPVVDTDTPDDTDTTGSAQTPHKPVVTDYVVTIVDENGDEASTEVTVVNVPPEYSVRVTLSDETNATAPSGVTALFNGSKKTLWPVESLSSLTLPQTVTLPATVAGKEWLSFEVQTDFTNFDFDETVLVRSSSSSFCIIDQIPVDDPAIYARLKYQFEDLPLSALSLESSGAFDYNDVVLIVDILNP